MPVATARSDNEGSDNEITKTKNTAEDSHPGSGSDGEGEEGSEYEIEEVLDAKRGYFPDGRMGYFVKWKGYDHADNSWVDEQDAGNAIDLVNEYWKKHPHKKRHAAPRKSVDKKSPKKDRKSVASDGASEAEPASTKKRSRKSTTQKAESEDEMDVDEVAETRAPKKSKKSASTQVSKAKSRAKSPEEGEKVVGNMTDYMHMKNWEGLVKKVDTVERDEEGDRLMVYFTLTTGECVVEETTICKERFPRKLIEFYESNLRWKSVEDQSP